MHDFGEYDGYNCAMALSPNGRLMAGAFETELRVWETATRQEVGRFRGHRDHISALTFSPDGRTLASAGADAAILCWRLNVEGQPSPPLALKALNGLWTDLGGADARKARQALWSLVAVPEQAVPFLKEHLPIVPNVPAQRMKELIADLDARRFPILERAMRELAALGEGAVPALHRALEGQPTAEQRQRITRLLAQLDQPTPSPVPVSLLRAIEVLESIGTEPARKVLQGVANGLEGIPYTGEAAAALRRLSAAKN